MAGIAERMSERWRDGVMLVLAVWLFISPWLLGYVMGAPLGGGEATATVAAWNAWVIAVILAVVTAWALFSFAEWQDWVTGLLGAWLVIAPWVLGYGATMTAVWNHVIVGVVIVVLAAWELWDVRHPGTRAAA